jgi:hypothetical protein
MCVTQHEPKSHRIEISRKATPSQTALIYSILQRNRQNDVQNHTQGLAQVALQYHFELPKYKSQNGYQRSFLQSQYGFNYYFLESNTNKYIEQLAKKPGRSQAIHLLFPRKQNLPLQSPRRLMRSGLTYLGKMPGARLAPQKLLGAK